MIDRHLRQIQQILDNERNMRRFQNFDLSDIASRARNPLLNDVNSSNIQRHLAQIDKQIQDSLKLNRHFPNTNDLLSKFPKFDSPIYKELGLIQENVANRNNIQKQLSEVLSSIDKSLSNNRLLQNSFKQYEDLFKSNLGTAVFASSLRQNEIDLIKQNILDRARIAELNLPKALSPDIFESFRRGKIWEQIDTLRDTFAGKLAIEFRDVFENVGNQQEAYDRISSIIEGKISETSQSGYTRFELLSLIISILAIIVSIYSAALPTYQFIDSKKSGDEQKAQAQTIIQLAKEIVKNTAQDTPDDNQEVYYEVERKAQLKAKPSFSSVTIGGLTPKSKVRIMFINHKWVFVECFNYFEGVPRYGWVNKKYLRGIK